MNESRSIISKVVLLVVVALVVGVLVSRTDWAGLWAGAWSVFTSPKVFREWVRGFGLWAPVVFWLVQAVQVVVAPIPGGLTIVAGAAMFGIGPALALSLSGIVVGSLVLFAAERRWGRPLVAKLLGEEAVSRYTGLLERGGGGWLFLAFLLPFLPDDALVAVAGISGMGYRRFLLLVTFGRLPTVALTGYAAAGLVSGSAVGWVSAGLFAVVALVLVFGYGRHLEEWLLRRGGSGAT